MNTHLFSLRSLPIWLALFSLITLLSITGCRSHGGEADTEWRSFRGHTVWVPQGLHGFWGIRTHEFGRVHPVRPVDEPFHREGLQVRGELLLRPDMASIRSWGRMAEIRGLEVTDE